jgi:PTS system mannose-specific IIC component
MIIKVFIVSVVGGFLCLDRILIQAMLARPVVAAPLIGLILGDPHTGLIAGAFLELIWIDRVPIGAYIPPNDTVAAILIAAASILAGQSLGSLPPALIALAVLLLLPIAFLAQQLDLWIVRRNEHLARKSLADAQAGDDRAIARRHLQAMIRAWLVAAGLILLTLPPAVITLTWAYPRLAGWAIRGLTLTYGLIPLIGVAVALQTISIRGAVPIVCAVFLVASGAIVWFRGI